MLFQCRKHGTRAVDRPYVDFRPASQVVHQSTVLASALNGDSTSRPSARRNAAGYAASAAILDATTFGSSSLRLVMSGISMILKLGSTRLAACSSLTTRS